jgi:hypothetical protein
MKSFALIALVLFSNAAMAASRSYSCTDSKGSQHSVTINETGIKMDGKGPYIEDTNYVGSPTESAADALDDSSYPHFRLEGSPDLLVFQLGDDTLVQIIIRQSDDSQLVIGNCANK